jgi:hypothetical protein
VGVCLEQCRSLSVYGGCAGAPDRQGRAGALRAPAGDGEAYFYSQGLTPQSTLSDARETGRAGDQDELVFCESAHLQARPLFIGFRPNHKRA